MSDKNKTKSITDDWSIAFNNGLTDGEVGAKENPDKYGYEGEDKEDYENGYIIGKTLPLGSGNIGKGKSS